MITWSSLEYSQTETGEVAQYNQAWIAEIQTVQHDEYVNFWDHVALMKHKSKEGKVASK